MPQTQLSSKLGQDNSIFDVKEDASVKKSRFDFSKKNYSTIDIGAVTPVDWFFTYPGDKVKLKIRYLLDTFPLEVPPMNNYYIRTHWYFIKMSALWKGWNTFITRGRSGSIDLKIPSITDEAITTSYQVGGKYRNYSCPNGLLDYLGIKPKYYNNDSTKASYLPYLQNDSDSFSTTGYNLTDEYNALIPFAYQKIVRYNYLSPNLMQQNKVWFPDDLEDHWYIDYGASNLNGAYFVPESANMPQSDIVANEVPTISDNAVDIRQLRYGLFGKDYFTDAKPWLVRGTETTTDFIGDFSSLLDNLTITGGNPTYKLFQPEQNTAVDGVLNADSVRWAQWRPNVGISTEEVLQAMGSNNEAVDWINVGLNNKLANVIKSSINNSTFSSRNQNAEFLIHSTLSANTWRNLLSLSVWQERNALTDGSYNQMIRAHWNEKPKAPEYAPLYLGGTTDLVSFGQVIQSSSSVSGSPLGTKAGVGSASGGSDVFSFDSNDYGIIMGVMLISPEVIYSDGVGHEWTDLTHDQQFQPEFANLGFQPILNKEIRVSGVTATDNDLFGYQTRYAYLKQRRNSVNGLFNLSSTQDNVFGPYVQKRMFTSNPALSEQFVTMSPNNLDRSFLSFSNLPAFKLQFASDVDLIRALPYQSTPETFGF